jgi:hypothetical protein
LNINATYLKAVGVGIVTGLLAALLFVVGSFVLTMTLMLYRSSEAAGSAGIGAVSIGFSEPGLVLVLIAAVAGFVFGFRRTIRRARR